MFVHTKNLYIFQRALWSDHHAISMANMCIIGDFNIALGTQERYSSVLSQRLPMEEFRQFISMMDLFDIHYIGNTFTWPTRRSTDLISAHLDRALASQGFLSIWSEVELLVLPHTCSDHNLILLTASVDLPPTETFSISAHVGSSRRHSFCGPGMLDGSYSRVSYPYFDKETEMFKGPPSSVEQGCFPQCF